MSSRTDPVAEPVGSSVIAVRPAAGSVVLTYDDGPTPGVTDRLLPVLAEASATATFFVLLTRVRSRVGLLRETLAAGHEVGLHGPDHRRLTTLPPETLATRFRDAKAELEDVMGAEVRWSRPPDGTCPSCAPPTRPAEYSCCTMATPTQVTVSTTGPLPTSTGSRSVAASWTTNLHAAGLAAVSLGAALGSAETVRRPWLEDRGDPS